LWGFFKKIVIADNCAIYVNLIFNDPYSRNGSEILIASILFAFQIYGDFSGYSDIAIGSASLFGFKLKTNFLYPYFSRDIAEFWRRWHISLSTWFRDYVYIPLGGSNGEKYKIILNVFIIFIISGFWHGANWTFIVWGLINAIYFLPLLILNKNRQNLNVVANNRKLPNLKETINMFITFFLVVIGWIFFRANNITDGFYMISEIFSYSILIPPKINSTYFDYTSKLIIFMLITEWMGRLKPFALYNFGHKRSTMFRWFFYSFIIFLIGMFMPTNNSQFIYFQF